MEANKKTKVKLEEWFKPMLCLNAEEPDLDSPFYIGTVKMDGTMVIIENMKNGFKFYSRRGLTYNSTIPEITEAFSRIQQSFRVIGELVYIDSEGHQVFRGCYDDKTEVLTENGWKLFKDLQVEDKIVTLNPKTNELEYQCFSNFITYHYKGKMIKISSDHTDLLVTPNHNVWVRMRRTRKNEVLKYGRWRPYHFREASQLPTEFYLKRDCVWKGKTEQWFILPEYRNKWNRKNGNAKFKKVDDVIENYFPKKKIKMNDWLAFLGLWLAEGSLSKNTVQISQKKYIDEVRTILKKLPFHIHEYNYGYNHGVMLFTINNKQLRNYLHQFGKCDEKFIPKWIFNLSKRQLRIFTDAYGLGDGSKRKGKLYQIITTSKAISDGFQEIAIKIGYGCQISKHKPKSPKSPRKILYKIYLNRYNLNPIAKKTEEYYKGKVYCITVPNHVMMVRRNGKEVWCGNSQIRCQISNKEKVDLYRKLYPVGVFLFDITDLNGINLTMFPFIKRWNILIAFHKLYSELLGWNVVRLVPISMEKRKMFDYATKKLGLEGIVLRKLNGIYEVAKRSENMKKLKGREHSIWTLPTNEWKT